MLRNAKAFNDDLRDLATEIHQLLSCLADVQDRAELDYLKDTVIDVMKAISDAANYIKDYIDQNTFREEDQSVIWDV